MLQLAIRKINKVRELVACYVLYNQRSYSVANFKYNIKVSVVLLNNTGRNMFNTSYSCRFKERKVCLCAYNKQNEETHI